MAKATERSLWLLLWFICVANADGCWSNWTEWTNCTFTCSAGTQERTRTCDNPPPADGAAQCFGESKETRFCNLSPCPNTRISCEDDVLHIECSLDGRINVVAAKYGRQDAVVCPHNAMSNTDCNYDGTLDYVRTICEEKRMCDVVHPNTDPCPGTYKYMDITYKCISIDQCESNPCENGAFCLDGERQYTCYCKGGFTGTKCETDIGECQSNPCQNGATCQDRLNYYNCSCAAGYTGSECQIDIDECANNLCQNGATCIDGVDGYICSCSAGHTGTLCLSDMKECHSNPCQNGATCHDGLNQYSCSCAAGYTGTTCQIDTDECASNPCQNGATCIDGVNGFSCSCSAGYTGTSCQTDIEECHSNPCQNGATCKDRVNGYTCLCVAGVIGSQCETALFVQTGRFTVLNKDYLDTLADTTSDDYKGLAAQIITEVRTAYSRTSYDKHIITVRDITFTKGSVLAKYTIDLNIAVTSKNLRQQLMKYIDDHSGYISNLRINSSSLTFEGAASAQVSPKPTETNWTTNLPEWSLITFLALFGIVVIVVIFLVAVILRRGRKQATDAQRLAHPFNDSNVDHGLGVVPGNGLWPKDDSWLRAQARNYDSMRQKREMGPQIPGYSTVGGNIDDWRLRGNRFRPDNRYVRRY